ncbi:MAG: Stp1/IreP family PP2C-type Ser/Thr phosphatase [Bacteroidales bacterium]|nr:Stp1/IreP family PP2C-type Ser/Thr phosphatase [Lachnoclostridium sp.]MCM1384236.1 Stp1/IreP family PP2C-type Ser/Thr phosphatase [Lachnoclostridium sp.]MCM1464736.1 Stp1/IreP family PP2C-type Ser/Thr phosphatase [Bacteroidales bacterium]
MFKTFSLTDIGKKRKVNQDYVYTSEQPVGNLPNLFVVADGMGGHNAGDYASKVTVETMVREAVSCFEKNPTMILAKAIEAANGVIYQKAHDSAEFEGMGTTVVAAVFIGGYLQVANVGDSRLYIINNKEIRQITRDHSLVEEMVRMGGIPRTEARNHPDKNIITRAVGVNETVEADFFTVELSEGDTVLMCTDGLTNMLEDEEIRMTISGGRDIVEKAQNLVKTANENGGKDNISVIIIEPFA